MNAGFKRCQKTLSFWATPTAMENSLKFKSFIHQTMIAAEKFSVAFELLMQVRNKAIDAYEKIMRMQA